MLRSTGVQHVNRNWARAQINTIHRRQRPKEKHQFLKGGRIRGEMFDGSIGTDSLSAKFSFHKIRARTKALEIEAQNEMWLTRPYLSKEETDFMNKGVFTPRRNIENDKGVVLDDFGAVINRGKHTGRLNPDQIVKLYGPEMLPTKYVKDLKQKQEQSEIMNRKQLKPDVRGADIWKSMEKYRTWERKDDVDLDFYRKYHNMAVPRKYPTTMPVPTEKWETWQKIEGFNPPKQQQSVETKSSPYNDQIPHPLAYDISAEESDYATKDEDDVLARHPFGSEYVRNNTRLGMLEENYAGMNQIEGGDSFEYKATRKEQQFKDVKGVQAGKASPEELEPLYASIAENSRSDDK